MLFNSFSFFVFFPVVTVLYFLLPQRYRWMLLLFASCIFYTAFIPYYILILFVTISIDYYAGIKIQESIGRRRKIYLIISIISTCTVLIIFKYFNFFNANLGVLAQFFDWNYPIGLINIILPIGLSFHTFQSLSYVIEVYRNKQKAERHFGIYSLYVMFYPQLVAGPIERPQNLLHQFYEKHIVDFERITAGLQRMLWGFFKKIVIADNLAVYVNQVYAFPHDYSGLTLLAATFFFAIQIYCDFSGYSDIAIGSAEVMGFKLMDNFKTPYFAVSIADFWRRWHISLSTWFRDYVYIPLGGNRVSRSRWYFNIMVTFVLSGLWHGANWTYIIWGGIHGFYLSMSHIKEKIFPAFAKATAGKQKIFIQNIFQRLWVFILVLFAWIFFRANTVFDAWYIVKASIASIFHPQGGLNALFLPLSNSPSSGTFYFSLVCAVLVIFFLAEIIDYKRGLLQTLRLQNAWVRYGLYTALILAIINLGVTQEMRFIYFQF